MFFAVIYVSCFAGLFLLETILRLGHGPSIDKAQGSFSRAQQREPHSCNRSDDPGHDQHSGEALCGVGFIPGGNDDLLLTERRELYKEKLLQVLTKTLDLRNE